MVNCNEELIHKHDEVLQISDKNSLIWVSAKLGTQEIPAMIDTGANPNCLSYRCLQGSPHLKRLERVPYSGKQIVDANGEPIATDFVVKCQLSLGTLTTLTEFVVIKSLPFSCIIGQKTLTTFDSWEVSNTHKILTINKFHIVPFHDSENLSLIHISEPTRPY